MHQSTPATLRREVGLGGAILLGLGSILGTGVFVSLGLAAGLVGSGLVIAIVCAGLVALFNGLSSAQLAANHPVSGGTYEYGHRYMNAKVGFIAGWLFLCAKSASAATAALGVSGYALSGFGVENTAWRTPCALAFVLLWTWIVVGGIRRSNRVNTVIVSLTVCGLIVFVAVAAMAASKPLVTTHWQGLFSPDWGTRNTFEAIALLFVAFTGYGRVATLGEEVRDPARTIPIAVIATLIVTVCLYIAVGAVSVILQPGEALGAVTRSTAAPLQWIAQELDQPWLAHLMRLLAVVAMAGVLLNLLLGLSRVWLAMARRGDMPEGLQKIDAADGSPKRAVWVTGLVIAAIASVGDIQSTWSFSAFTVLVYYSITNMCALRLAPEERRFPRGIAVLGMLSCLGLAFWVQPVYWIAGLVTIALGFVWRAAWRARTHA